MTRKMKDSGIEWIGMIPEGWICRKLKFCSSFIQEKYNVDMGELKYVGLENIISWTGKYVETESVYDKEQALIFMKDDILWGKLRPYLAKVYYAIISGCCSGEFCVIRINNCYDKRFFWNLLISSEFVSTVDHSTYGAKMPRANADFIKNLIIPVPPLPEQHRIAAYLDATCAQIDAVIEKTRASIEEYKKLKQAVITQAVTKGIRPERKMKDSGIEWIGEIPEEWEVTKVKHVSLVVTDGAHVSPETENGVYDFVSTVNIENEHINFDNCLKTSESSYRYLVSTGCKPQIGDVLISKDGTVGKTVVVTEERDFVIASSLVIIRPNKNIISTKYLNYSLQSKNIQDKLILLMHGAGLKRVSVAKNANLNILLPELKEQTQIVAYLDAKCAEIETLIAKKQQLLTELESYKKSLIFEYVTGKKEVLG